jgi:hypothetical protein
MIVKPNDPGERGRLSCAEVDRALSSMLDDCISKAEYASKPAHWSTKKRGRITIHKEAIEADLAWPAVEALLRKDLRVHTGPMQRLVVEGRAAPLGPGPY